MIRKIILILALIFTISVFTACSNMVTPDNNAEAKHSMFVIVEETPQWLIVYHKTTRVMYAVSDASYNRGNFTPLVDAEGNPLLWDGRSDE